MDQLTPQLQKLGLTPTEAQLYLAGLSHPSGSSAQALTKETGLKRPTVYHALETLIQKGLVSKKGTEARRVFLMTAPEHLEGLLDSRLAALEAQKQELASLLPLLTSRMGSVSGETIDVKQFEGIDGIKMVVEEALYCRDRKWDILAPRTNFFSEFDKTYATYYLTARKQRGIVSRSLWESPHDPLNPTAPISKEVRQERNPRYLPSQLTGTFSSVLILFDDKVAIISSLTSHTAVLIQSKEIHKLLSAMFEGLWMSSTPIGQFLDPRL